MENPQEEVRLLLKWAFVLSILWLMGVGSIIAIKFSVQAARIIHRSGGEVRGMGKAMFAATLGILGLLPYVFALANFLA